MNEETWTPRAEGQEILDYALAWLRYHIHKMSRHFSQETPRLNPSQIGSRSCTAEESFYRILHRFFEGYNVEVKLIEGKLLGIDGNLEYNGIGNLILSTKEGINIIRGNAVQHLGLRGRKKQ